MAKQPNRREALRAAGGAALAAWSGAVAATTKAPAATTNKPRGLRVASLEFGVTPVEKSDTPYTGRFTGAVVRQVAGPLKTSVTLLEQGDLRVCLVASDFNSYTRANTSDAIRQAIAADLDLPVANVVLTSTHNHSDVAVASNAISAWADPPPEGFPKPEWLPAGKELLEKCRSHVKRLPELLRPVTVWWAEGSEGRITYNRKGRRADGSTYFMREEDRDLVGVDFNGDIDRQAPIVVLKDERGNSVTAIAQFTGHPVTCYHPEKPIVFGDWPRVACDRVAGHLAPSGALPVSFLQGCAADVNSKGMFRGGVEESTRFGNMLGQSYIEALGNLRPSERGGFDYAVEKVGIPLAPLPPVETLRAEIAEMEAYIRRAAAGDEDTLHCVGLNFPTELTPSYRGRLVERILPWNRWALGLHEGGRAGSAPEFQEVEIHIFRLGDVGIVGMPFEPFQGIGRQIRARSPLPLAIPCGYTNVSYGYLTDGPNTGDREYMSAFYRYSEFRPPYRKPAGDVLADKTVEVFARFLEQADDA
ncbi:MAG: hypothetical protein RBS80_02280 [Thermoguttaceae bacterium]|jgi:hypothetical protein|nr:hypothetical protein [Thermoguttaceae bacterium]